MADNRCFDSRFLAMAAPPIPSGALFIFIVMFAQLDIPSEAIIRVVVLNSILDFCYDIFWIDMYAGRINPYRWKFKRY